MQRNPNDVIYNREQIAAIKDRNEAITKAASQDGLYSLPELIAILQDIRKITEDEIEALLKKMTGLRSLEKLHSKKYSKDADIFVKYGEDVMPELHAKAKQKLVDLSPESLSKFVQTGIDHVLKKIASDASKKENEELVKQLTNHLKTDFHLVCALAIYNDMDYKQNHVAETVIKEGANVIGSLFASKNAPTKRDEIEAPLHLMKELAKHITIHAKTHHHWHQVERWIMGLHYRSYNIYPADQKDEQGNVKKNSKGEYIGVKGDAVDGYLSKHGVCKYSLSFYHRQHAEHIHAIVSAYKEPVAESSPLIQAEVNASPDQRKEKTKHKEKIATFLNRYKKDPEDVQFSILIDALDNCEVSEDDERRLKKYLDSRKKKVDAYREAWFSTWWVPTFFVPRRHAAATKEALNKIKNSEDVRYHLTALYDLWVETDGKGSKDIHPAITEVLSGAFSILANGSEAELKLTV